LLCKKVTEDFHQSPPCLRNECATDEGASVGGRYTSRFFESFWKEHAWTPGIDGRGWGTKVLVQRKPDGNSVVFGTKTSEPQTDLAVDFVCHNGKWTWHYPTDRERYIYVYSIHNTS
jgi:hypothetical protein